MKTTRKLLDPALKKGDSEMPLKIKLEPVEAADIPIPSINQPKSDEVMMVGQECSSGSQFSLMVAEKKDVDSQWVKTGCTTLLGSHKNTILHGNPLNDAIMSFAQKLLKKQFPNINGLQNMLLQAKKQVDEEKSQCLQVIHCRGNHWILASTVHNESSSRVTVYDSLYDDIDAGTLAVIRSLFGSTAMPEIIQILQKQHGVTDYGVFAIVFATAICFKQELVAPFNQGVMRHHLVQCFEKGACLPFPFVQHS